MSKGAHVEMRGAVKRFDSVDGTEGPEVLRGVDLELRPGSSTAVVGPSGSGKSTLLNMIGALDRLTGGQIRIDGVDLASLSDDALARLRNAELGFVFQSHHLMPQLSALENVLVPNLVRPDPVARRSAPGRAKELLERVGLGGRVHHRPAQLSGGECQRVAVVRALINEPVLLLADEPTGSLDRDGADSLGRLLRELNEERGMTLLVVTHSAELAATMHRTLELRDGRLAADGVDSAEGSATTGTSP